MSTRLLSSFSSVRPSHLHIARKLSWLPCRSSKKLDGALISRGNEQADRLASNYYQTGKQLLSDWQAIIIRLANNYYQTGKQLLLFGWLLNVPATCSCVSETFLLNFARCHTTADLTCHLTQSPYITTSPTSPSADPITPGSRQGSQF